MRHNAAKICLALLILSVIAALYTLNNVLSNKQNKSLVTLDTMSELLVERSNTLSDSLRDIEPIIQAVADDLSAGYTTVDNLEQRLYNDLADNSWMFGLGVAFEPYQADSQSELWSRYYKVLDDGRVKPIEIRYDYTEFEHAWYRKPLLQGAHWNEPFYGQASQALLAEYGVPFWLPGKNPNKDKASGVVFGNFSLEKLKKLVQLNHPSISYYQILSKQGRFIVHPDESHILSGDTVFEHAWEREDTALNSMAIHAVAGESGHISHIDPMTKSRSWMIYHPINGLDWSMVVVVDQARSVSQDNMRQSWFVVVLWSLISVVLLTLFVVLKWSTIPRHHYLTASMTMSLFVFLGVLSLWKISDYYPSYGDDEQLKMMSADVLSEFANKQVTTAHEHKLSLPKFVKTGVYLQSVEFEGANNLKVSGYVWQHYKKGEHQGIARGIVLPEAEVPHIEEVYRDVANPDDPDCVLNNDISRDCTELIGWYVSATLRQEFDYSLYPLDSQQVWLRMWHKDYRDNIILVPDLESYALPNPRLKPGVQHGFVLPGWKIEQSWFSINHEVFSTNFGDARINGVQHKPELFYNVNIQREFLNPFVSRIIPVALVSVFMFLIVLISNKSGKSAEWLGFSASDVVQGLSALFFVVGISHADLRNALSSSRIMYFEYLYFVIYVMLLYVAVSSIYIAKRDAIEGRDENFISKNLYWPVLSIVMFLVTYGVFYQ